MNPLAIASIGLPLLASLLLIVTHNRFRHAAASRVTLGAAGLTGLITLALPLSPHLTPGTGVVWLPGMGAMGFDTGFSSAIAACVTALACVIVLAFALHRSGESPAVSGAVILLALAGGNGAFLADHFLGRYVALEIVALCAALAPLIEAGTGEHRRLAWTSYVVLRVGDAGLLVAILLLWNLSGTLIIDPALSLAATATDPTGQVLWASAGLVLAVWVKLGGWPFHLWSQAGPRISLASHAWLLATLLPNLGAYLLYRITPLLVATEDVRMVTLWAGTAGMVLTALLAATATDERRAMVFTGASQAGLALLLAASGMKAAVWLGILVLTPVRVLLMAAAELARRTTSQRQRQIGVVAYAVGGLALTGYSLLATWWARESGVRLDVLLLAQVAVALWGVRAARTSLQLARTPSEAETTQVVGWKQAAITGLLCCGVLAGTLAFGPLARSLTHAAYMLPPPLPTAGTLVRYTATAPGILVVLLFTLTGLQLHGVRRLAPAPGIYPGSEVVDLENALAKTAQAVHTVVEVWGAERLVTLFTRGVTEAARLAWFVEHNWLERLVQNTARSAMTGSLAVYRAVEERRLEGLLRLIVRSVLALSRALRRWHSGRLRRNLLWIPVALALAMSITVLWR